MFFSSSTICRRTKTWYNTRQKYAKTQDHNVRVAIASHEVYKLGERKVTQWKLLQLSSQKGKKGSYHRVYD